MVILEIVSPLEDSFASCSVFSGRQTHIISTFLFVMDVRIEEL